MNRIVKKELAKRGLRIKDKNIFGLFIIKNNVENAVSGEKF